MEVLNTPTPQKTQILSMVPIFAPKSSITTLHKRNTFKFNTAHSQLHLKLPFLINFPFSNRRNYQILAHFGRPSNRRNSLRKKLAEDQQVRHNDPTSNFQNLNRSFDSFRSNSDYDSVKQSDFNSNYGVGDDVVEPSSVEESKSKLLGESVLWNKLENWVDQYKKDSEFWGIGSAPIFTVFQDSDGNVERVVVNEDEILRRNRVEPSSIGEGEFEDLTEVNLKISHAKCLAREMESGEYVLPKNSSVAKFVVPGGESGFVDRIRGVALRPDLLPKLSRVGIAVLCGFFVFWTVKRLFAVGEDQVELTRVEKEMMRRKLKSRIEKENLEKGSVEVLQESSEPTMVSTKRPWLDKQELVTSILKAKASNDKLALRDSSSTQTIKSMDLDNRIQEIREMARRAREIEGGDSSLVDSDGEDDQPVNEELPSNEMEVVKQRGGEDVSFLNNLSNVNSVQATGLDGTTEPTSLDNPKSDDTGIFSEVASVANRDMRTASTSNTEVLESRQSATQDLIDSESTSNLLHAKKNSIRTKPRVIRSVKEAREYLSKKCDKQEPNEEPQVGTVQEGDAVLRLPRENEMGINTSQRLDNEGKVFKPSNLDGTSDFAAENACEDFTLEKKESVSTKNNDPEDAEEGYVVGDLQKPRTSSHHEASGSSSEAGPTVNKENWMEKNFHEFEPVLEKIGVGFRGNYMVARERVNRELNISSEMTQPESKEDESELEWMKDDSLREIVFNVRENELAGRDPFYLMDAEDKLAFFKGLEKKVENENEKLLNLHEWLHSNIENLDYGADGISLYDPPEKIIPRWKGPPVDKDPEFLNNFIEQRKAFVAKNAGIPYLVKKDEKDSLQEYEESPSHENIPTSSTFYDPKKKFHDGAFKNSKTVIEGSDGSVRAGKKSGKEYWQHTKKWSRGFLEAYNAETDPEVKAVMKDMGKDLDRWITEKETQEAADMMTKIPERGRRFIEKKLNKLKREMELFGPQAVVSKYREYAEEKEEDCLWWLDLPFVLCIELYTYEDGDQKIGFYSLEMAADLELNPKQYHVIALEDPGDCKNLCHIIQAHMEMLGNGNAFVVARPPKDAFREAKANGFSVTVIRKGELQLNVDQTLEEVEEQITDIGSKIYHDKITRERSVDISSLTKGVVGTSIPAMRKRSKRKLKKPAKH